MLTDLEYLANTRDGRMQVVRELLNAGVITPDALCATMVHLQMGLPCVPDCSKPLDGLETDGVVRQTLKLVQAVLVLFQRHQTNGLAAAISLVAAAAARVKKK